MFNQEKTDDYTWCYSINGQIESICGFDKYKSSYLRCVVHLILPDQWTAETKDESPVSIVSNSTQATGSSERVLGLPFQIHLKLSDRHNSNHRILHPRLIVIVLDENDHEIGTGFVTLPTTPGRFELQVATCRKTPVTLTDKLSEMFLSGSRHSSIERSSLFLSMIEAPDLHTSSKHMILKKPSFPQSIRSHGSVKMTVNIITSSSLMDKAPVDPIEQVIEAFKRAKAKLIQLRRDIQESTIYNQSIHTQVIKDELTVDYHHNNLPE